MRLGIKGKQVLGVTSIVGAVVVVLSVLHLARLAQRQPRREPRARRAAGQRDLSSRAQQVVVDGVDPLRGAARRSRAAVDSRVEPLLEERHVRGDRRRRRRRGRARRSGARRAAAAAGRRSRRRCWRSSPLSQLRAIYSGQGRNLEFRQPLLLGDTEFGSIRIGVSTLLIRQRSRRVAAAGGRDRARRARRRGDRARCCSRSCCCGRFT